MVNYDVVLQHHGVKGQRHGIRNAEWYPISAWKAHLASSGNKKSSDIAGDKIKKSKNKNRTISVIKKKVSDKKAANKRNADLAKARAAKAKSLADKKEKEEIIKTGNIDKALQRLDDFTNEELKAITERNKAKIAVAQAKTDKIVSSLGTMQDVTNKLSNIAKNSISVYNSVAEVANTFGDKNFKPISFQTNNQNNNQNQNDKNKK